jgi:hypothetical protein
MVAYSGDARAAIGRCEVTVKAFNPHPVVYSVATLRRMASMTAPCYGCKRQRVRADLERCHRCGMSLCDRCAGRCFCRDSQRVTETARAIG